jgi:hypothetical protein
MTDHKQAITFPMSIDDAKLKELVWKLDREIWAHVPNPLPPEDERAWTQSKAREESAKCITEYFGSLDLAERYLNKIKELCGLCELNYSNSFAAIRAIQALIKEYETNLKTND